MFEEDLDLAEMQRAASMLVGVHDFRNFCTLDSSNHLKLLTRALEVCELEEVALPFLAGWGMRCVVLSIRSRGFLYNQVSGYVIVMGHAAGVLDIVGCFGGVVLYLARIPGGSGHSSMSSIWYCFVRCAGGRAVQWWWCYRSCKLACRTPSLKPCTALLVRFFLSWKLD